MVENGYKIVKGWFSVAKLKSVAYRQAYQRVGRLSMWGWRRRTIYRIAGKFGGDLNLAVGVETAKLNSANIHIQIFNIQRGRQRSLINVRWPRRVRPRPQPRPCEAA